jgi:hypothetical protein
LPGEFVIVADADERPSRSGVLNIWITNVRLIDHAIALEVGRHVEVIHLAAVGYLAKVEDCPVVAMRHLFGIFDKFVDKVAKMEYEAQLMVSRRPLVLPNHPPIGVLGAFVDTLARHECKSPAGSDRQSSGAVIVLPTRLPAPDSSTKRYQYDVTGRQSADQNPRRPVCETSDTRATSGRNDVFEGGIFGDLNPQFSRCAGHRHTVGASRGLRWMRPDRPTQHRPDRDRDAPSSAASRQLLLGRAQAAAAPIAAAKSMKCAATGLSCRCSSP